MNPALVGILLRVGAVLVLVVALFTGYETWASHQRGLGRAEQKSVDQRETDRIKAEARIQLDAETAKVRAAEQALRDFKDKREIEDAANQKLVAGLQSRLRDAAAVNGGRLRDPNQTGGCRNGSGGAQSQDPAAASSGGANPPEAGGLLSVQLTDLLNRLLLEADAINDAYIACRSDTLSFRGVLN